MEQVRNEQTIYSAAVYCRLSKDDEQAGESVSIETQKMMLTDAPTIGKLSGRSEYVGGSACFFGITIGYEYILFNDDIDPSIAYHGLTVSLTWGLSIPAESHGGVSGSGVLTLWGS